MRRSSLALVSLFVITGCKTAPSGPPDDPPSAQNELRELETLEQNVCESKESCETLGVPEILCCTSNTCLGSIIRIGGSVTNTSSVSARDCESKINGTFDAYCVDKKRPGDCAGDCDSGQCRDSGAASDIKVMRRINTSTPTSALWDCSATRGFCGCRCRGGS